MNRSRAIPWLLAAVVAVVVGMGVAAWREVSDADGEAADGAPQIVMLGDSITEEGDWRGMFPDRSIVDAGYSGYTTEQLVPLARDIVSVQPDAVFVLAGTNDVFWDEPPEWTAARLDELINEIEGGAPDARIIVQTVLPAEERSGEIVATNASIRSVAAARGLEVLDLYPAFDDGTGALRGVETYDGVHLTTAGYARWATLLEPWFARLDQPPSS